MFDWLLGPCECPVPAEEKDWLEKGMAWLSLQFGQAALRKPVVLPTAEFFPEVYDGSKESIRAILDRVCGIMNVNPGQVDLTLYKELAQVTAGQYLQGERTVVAVEERSLEDPCVLVTVMAHELAHAQLLGNKKLSPESPNQEHLTDLAVVFFGLGIFLANTAVIYQQWTNGGWCGWGVARRGYLNERQCGYALDLYARERGEAKPKWARYLRPNVRLFYDQGRRFQAREKHDHK